MRSIVYFFMLSMCVMLSNMGCNPDKSKVDISIETIDATKLILGIQIKNNSDKDIIYHGTSSSYFNDQFSMNYAVNDTVFSIKAKKQILFGVTLGIKKIPISDSIFLEIDLLKNFNTDSIKDGEGGELILFFEEGWGTGYDKKLMRKWSSNSIKIPN